MNPRSWAAVSKKAYWDRNVSLDRWKKMVAVGHRSYLPDAISAITPVEFIGFYGLANFTRDWPTMRAKLPAEAMKNAGMFDLAWSRAVGGGWNLKPTGDFFDMPEKRRFFLTLVARTPGKSIYEIAKSLGLQYRRAHDHAVLLIKTGKIRSVEALEGGHRKLKLYPTCKT